MTLFRKCVTCWHMPNKSIFFVSVILCGMACIAKVLFSYAVLSRYFGRHQRMLCASTMISPQQIQQAILIKRAIALVVNYFPCYSNCLVQAMVAKFWCKFYHIPYLLFIGLAKESEKPLGRDGHAWLTAGPIALSGGHSLSTHVVISTYSNLKHA